MNKITLIRHRAESLIDNLNYSFRQSTAKQEKRNIGAKKSIQSEKSQFNNKKHKSRFTF